MFSLGIVHPQLFPETSKGEGAILETISLLVADGFFDALEISSIKDSLVRKRVKELLQQHGIRKVYCCAPPILMNKINLNALEEEERAEGVRQVKNYLDEALFMEAEIFTVLSGPDPGPEKRLEAREHLILSLTELCSYVEERDSNLTITLETFDRAVDKKCLIGPTPEAVQVARKVSGAGFENFGLTLDQGHLPLLEEKPGEAINEAIHFLFHIHLGNCVRTDQKHPLYGDQHPRYGLGGCHLELGDLVSFLQALADQGFCRDQLKRDIKPVLSFEVKPALGESSLQTLEETKKTWLQAWGRFADSWKK
jgi:sugar phosphate isomerase/epimerase